MSDLIVCPVYVNTSSRNGSLLLSHTTTIFTFLHVHFLTCVLYMLAIFYVDLMYFSLVDQVEIVGSPLLHIMIIPLFK